MILSILTLAAVAPGWDLDFGLHSLRIYAVARSQNCILRFIRNAKQPASFEHFSIGNFGLFRFSDFGFGIYERCLPFPLSLDSPPCTTGSPTRSMPGNTHLRFGEPLPSVFMPLPPSLKPPWLRPRCGPQSQACK
jgi:hypothetical protein